MITVKKELFSLIKDSEIYKYQIKNENGFQVNVLNYGGTITEIYVKDNNGQLKNIVLGYKNFEKYVNNGSYAGMLVGRTAGRIENAQFTIDDILYKLEKNNGENNLHGGINGFSNKILKGEIIENGVQFYGESLHLEEGFPGNLQLKVKYVVTEDNKLIIEYNCVSDKNTYVNLTNHSYFNLSGDMSENGDEQNLIIDANNVCELKEGLIPTGKLLDVNKDENKIFDLRKGIKIKEGIEKGILEKNEQFNITRAYDHPFVLNNNDLKSPQVVLSSEKSGITMEIYTTEKVAVVYTGNFLEDVIVFDSIYDENTKTVNDTKNKRYLGVAIETQNYPNGINEKNFPECILEANKEYKSKTEYKFFIK